MATSTDVKLLANQIRIEGQRQVIVDALDLCVDSPVRRSEHATPDRRALVHDAGDALTINYGWDYPGGVTINHLKTIHPRGKKLSSPDAIELTITGNTKITGNLTVDGQINGDLNVKGRVLFPPKIDPGVLVPVGARTRPAQPLDLAAVVFQLQQDIAALKKKVGL